ncbi:unnamed protein product [Urochloa humidicola]
MDDVKKNNAAAAVPDQPIEPAVSFEAQDDRWPDGQPAALCNAIVPAVVLIFLGCILVGTVREVRHRPLDLAFVAFSYAALAAIFLCLRRAERLPREEPSPDGGEGHERRRLQLAVWTLSTALSCAFAYRVSLIMPAVLVVVVWSMTLFVVIVGFFVLVLHKDQGYRALEGEAAPRRRRRMEGLAEEDWKWW